MKRLFFAVLLFPLATQAQWNVNLFGGFANYIGELQSSPYTTQQAHFAGGLGLQYDLTGHFSLLTNINFGHVGASDAYSQQADVRARNLSFGTNIGEVNLLAEYNLIDLRNHNFSPYIYVGVAIYHFNPYAYDTLGNKVYLRPLSTEGEGLPQYPGIHPYALTQFAIPFGGGIKFRISDKVILAYDIGLRKLFTDYLDDVSGKYVDQNVLLADKGPQAVEMAYRGNELKGGAGYPPVGTIRGNARTKDWYYFSGIRVIIAFNTSGIELHRRARGILDCPKNVY
ncbi:MAG TPA: DUF6089 family protein [Puia sp.]|nr:DUF6089 family protein [Puia sp.]